MPDPESYKEDIGTVVHPLLKRSESKLQIGFRLDEFADMMLASDSGNIEQMYCALASGAESGSVPNEVYCPFEHRKLYSCV